MINNKFIYFSIAFSLLFHFTIIFFFTSKTNDKDIYVVNLSEFREFSFVQPAPPKPKEIVEEKTIKKIEDKPIEQNKILDNKKKKNEKKKDVVPIKTKETEEIVEKVNEVEKVIEPNKKKIQKEEVKKLNNLNEIPEIKSQIQPQKQFSLNKKKSVIKDQLLSEYLSFISYEINKMASKSYPIQSIKILNSFKFPKPPSEILDNKGYLRIKIPVNYILK